MSHTTDSGDGTRAQAKDAGQQVAGSAKDAGQQVAGSAKDAGQEVAGTAKEKAGETADEAKWQARHLYAEGREQLTQHAGEQQRRAAEGLSSVTGELRGMVDGSDQQGPVTDLARQAADRVDQAARWLGDREPAQLLDDVRRFAARRPGTFLALAAGAGVLAGRLGRGLKDSGSGSDSGASSTGGAATSSGTTTTSGPSTGGATYGTAAVEPRETRPPAESTGTAAISAEERTAPRGTAL
ncbi:YtxH domain-containing protein [Pseudokineococcus marinus]|uniref:YtxH domain-containing protein n=1 Tax=Pseudokineococcus marinus TaxID=351215 RepID=A0A849BNI7_9ACTN|nr:YtxH domain-containing protein [Pseudokineococcus marinus]NNH22154.1 YtxH domain-containing protein [Pseudokineococcus marinus]